jgi:hypothetical protein
MAFLLRLETADGALAGRREIRLSRRAVDAGGDALESTARGGAELAEQALSQLKSVQLRLAVPSVAVLRARAWMLGPPLLFGLVAALTAALVQGTAWRAKAEVSFQAPPVGTQYMEAQTKLARSPILASRVVARASVPGMSADRFLRHSSASPPRETELPREVCIDFCVPLETEILTLSVSDQRSAAAVKLTNAYTTEVVRFKRELDESRIQTTLASIHALMRRLRARGQANTPRYRTLAERELQMRAVAQTMPAPTARKVERASSFRPHALRNGFIGGAGGVLLGLALVAVLMRQRRLTR